MACKYCAQYLRRAGKEIENFGRACSIIRLDPAKPADAEKIVVGMMAVGEYGAVRLEQEFGQIIDEVQFREVVSASRNFYWMVLDFWADEHARNAKTRTAGRRS